MEGGGGGTGWEENMRRGSDRGFPFLDDFIQKNMSNTPGLLSECRSRRANHQMRGDVSCMWKSK